MSQNCDCQCPESIMVPMTGFGVGFNTGPIKELVKEIVREALQEHSCGIDYSFEEQWTGKYWVDGKKVYQRTILGGDNIPKNERLLVPHGIQNMHEMVSFQGVQMNEPGFSPLPFNSLTGPNIHPISVNMLPDSIQIVAKDNVFPGNWYVTVKYTCTDR